MMAKEEQRVVNHNFRTTEAEDALIRQKMQAYGIKNQSAFYRAIALNGYMLKLDLPEIREMIRLLKNLTTTSTRSPAGSMNTDPSMRRRSKTFRTGRRKSGKP